MENFIFCAVIVEDLRLKTMKSQAIAAQKNKTKWNETVHKATQAIL